MGARAHTAASYTIAVAIVLVAWQIASTAFDVPLLFPSPLATARTGISLIREGRLQTDIAISIWRILTGFVIGSVFGAALGLLIGSSRIVADLLAPYVNFLRFVASIAWIPVFILWFGIGEVSKIVLIVYTTTFVVLLNTVAGVVNVHRTKLRVARCFGASPAQIFIWVTLPATIALHPDRHASRHDQLVPDGRVGGDGGGGVRDRVPHLQLASVDGDRRDLRRHVHARGRSAC